MRSAPSCWRSGASCRSSAAGGRSRWSATARGCCANQASSERRRPGPHGVVRGIVGQLGSVPPVLRVARREPSAVLLAAQLAGVLLYPFMDSEGVGRALFSVFGIAVLGLVVLAVRST